MQILVVNGTFHKFSESGDRGTSSDTLVFVVRAFEVCPGSLHQRGSKSCFSLKKYSDRSWVIGCLPGGGGGVGADKEWNAPIW